MLIGQFTTGSGSVTAAAAGVLLLRRFPAAALLHTTSNCQAAPPADAGSQSAGHSSSAGDGSASSQSAGLAPGVFQRTCRVAGRTWTFETGRLAKLAHGSCIVTAGGTSVLSTAVVDPTPQPEADSVPLQVEYRERLSAGGRLPSRPDRRERVGTDREVLAGRLVDRALRPLMPPGFLYDTQVWCQVLSVDGCVDPEVVAINAASAALLLAREIPFTHPVGAVKVGCKHHRMITNPSIRVQSEQQVTLNLTYAGSPGKATAIEATAKQVSAATFVRAMKWAATSTGPLIEAQQALAAAAGHQPTNSTSPVAAAAAAAVHQQLTSQHLLPLLWLSQQVQQAVQQLMQVPLQQLFSQHQQQHIDAAASNSTTAAVNKESRAAGLTRLRNQLLSDLRRMGVLADEQSAVTTAAAAGLARQEDVLRAFDMLQSRVMRQQLLQGGCRVDGRGLAELRPISCQAGPLPRVVHGSGLFTRGETQSMATATVGHDRDVGQVEGLFSRAASGSAGSSGSSLLHLHYSFPPFSVGELGKAGPPNRREVGHGNLARAALVGLMPAEDDFPFTVRVTADTLSSSGSSSMAAVCAGALALRAAGVPMRDMAAGISVGLITAHPPQLSGPGEASAAPGGDSSSSSSDGSDGSYSSHVAQGVPKQVRAAADSSAAEEQDEAAADDSSSSSGSDEDDSSSSSSSSSDNEDSSSNTGLSSSYGSALLLTDIQGIEDHHGDMDFKVAGTARGITAVQLDTKLPGVDLHLLAAALQPAAAARHTLLKCMAAAVAEYEGSLDPSQQPQHGSQEIMKELVPRLIGPQGSTLLEVEEQCGASLLVDDTGAVTIYAPTQLQYQHAVAAVQEVEGRGVQAGQVYKVKVLRVVDFGAYVALPNGLPALLHVSELSHSKIREVRDVVKEGQEFEVLCKGRDAKGFVRLSLKDLLSNPEGGAKGSSSSSSSSSGAAAGESASSSKRGRHGREDRPRALTWQPSQSGK